MSRYYVGLDVHWKQTTVCILDGNGKRVKRLTIRGAWSQIVDELKQLSGKVSVCFEALTAYDYLYEMLSKVAERVEVAHPGQLRLIFWSKKKSDRAGAAKHKSNAAFWSITSRSPNGRTFWRRGDFASFQTDQEETYVTSHLKVRLQRGSA